MRIYINGRLTAFQVVDMSSNLIIRIWGYNSIGRVYALQA